PFSRDAHGPDPRDTLTAWSLKRDPEGTERKCDLAQVAKRGRGGKRAGGTNDATSTTTPEEVPAQAGPAAAVRPRQAGLGPQAVPDHPPPAGDREGHAPEHPVQRLRLPGEPGGHQDADQGGRRGTLRREGRGRPDDEPRGQEAPLPHDRRPIADLEKGDRDAHRRGQDRILLTVVSRQ